MGIFYAHLISPYSRAILRLHTPVPPIILTAHNIYVRKSAPENENLLLSIG